MLGNVWIYSFFTILQYANWAYHFICMLNILSDLLPNIWGGCLTQNSMQVQHLKGKNTHVTVELHEHPS